MKVSFVVEKLGSKARIARELGIARSTVTMWGDNVPLHRQYELQVRFPELFPRPAAEKRKAI